MSAADAKQTFYSISGCAQFLSVEDLLNESVSEVGEQKTWMGALCNLEYHYLSVLYKHFIQFQVGHSF